jgi:predicted RNA polymerase sigma factor
VQAAIAACHATAPTADRTDWPRIAALYRTLAEFLPTPVVELNYAVAVGMARGPAAGLPLVEALEASGNWPAITCSRRPGPTCFAAWAAATRRRPLTGRHWS